MLLTADSLFAHVDLMAMYRGTALQAALIRQVVSQGGFVSTRRPVRLTTAQIEA